MRKNSFIEGAMIATIGVIVCKFIGLVYVIPFYALIGKTGGILYSYGYSIYIIFLNLSTSGIPLAISKIVSEYNVLGYNNTKERAYKIGFKILMCLGLFFFVILMIFAPSISKLIIGQDSGGWTIKDITLIIRIVSTALLIVPLLSVTKGYFQGHKIIIVSSISNVIEQLVRVVVILGGSYMTVKVLNLSLRTTIGVSVFAATIGAISAYLYLILKIKKNKALLNRNEPITREEAKITNKDILKKIIYYALPFVVIELLRSLYSVIDVVTVVRTINNLGYNIEYGETVFAVVTTWGSKINMIVISLAIGMGVSIIPNISSSHIKNDTAKITSRINQSLSILLLIALPSAIGLSFLSDSVWTFFYGIDSVSSNLFKYFVFQTISYSVFSILIDIVQSMNKTKLSLGSLLLSFLLKAILNVPLMIIFHKIGIEAGFGSVAATLIAQTISSIVIIYVLIKKHLIKMNTAFRNIIEILLCSLIMLVVLYIFNYFIEIKVLGRTTAIYNCLIFGIIGIITYLFLIIKFGILKKIIGETAFMKLKEKIIKRKKKIIFKIKK